MADDNDNDLMIDEDLLAGGIYRWLPTAVVMTAVVGFVALAWYAYHSGAQSMRDEDLLVVEADKTPMKEKPLDPGGMKFPNQDKTIFETFGSNPQPPKVERVLPAPEEPMPKEMDTSDTKSWVNDKLHDAPAAPEKVIGKEEKPAATVPAPAMQPVKPPAATEKPVASTSDIQTYTNEKAAEKTTPPAAPVAKTPPAKAPGGSAKAQLGAYRSEQEARAAWASMQKKFAELSGKEPSIVKAELGAKGIYYRLRVGGLSDAKAFCKPLAAKGQACLPTP